MAGALLFFGSSPKELTQIKDSRIKRGARGCRENAKSDDQIPGKQTLESLNPGLLEPFLPIIGR